jgi:luciferase family oxidoreductase group 1
LDKSPIQEGESAHQALARTVWLAQRAEQLGYHRFWVAEHHNTPDLASSAPEVLVAYLLANTSRIRVGSGGVMLRHYSPYKVAETFHLLASLAPGRVDLGVGRAPGGLPLSTKALQEPRDPARKPDFDQKLRQLDAFLRGGLPVDDPLAGLVATPLPTVGPERLLLGASVDSATLAANLGWEFVYAGQLNGDEENIGRVFEAFSHASGGRKPILALAALVADTDEDAKRQVSALRILKLHLSTGQSVNLGTRAQVEEFARQAGVTDYRVEEKTPSVVHGTAQSVRRQLDDFHHRFGVQEFILDAPILSKAERLSSIEALAQDRLSVAA